MLDAEPGAVIGLGLTREVSREALRAAALDGSIESLLDWRPVTQGDLFYSPAGTIHAIGGGIALIEVQQNLDLTYRLYDYGRPRELHLDEGAGGGERWAPGRPPCQAGTPGRDARSGGAFALERWTPAARSARRWSCRFAAAARSTARRSSPARSGRSRKAPELAGDGLDVLVATPA